MSTWPFRHNWTTPYRMTWSFKTTIISAFAGFEQRRAERSEPRRAIVTEVLEDARNAQSLIRFLWKTQAATFDHVDPITGYTSTIRFDDEQTIDHPGAHVGVSSLTLAVEPGSDNLAYDEPDAAASFQGRYVFPFAVNWVSGLSDALTLPRRTTDFDRGPIAVTRPIAFANRAATVTLLQAGRDESDALTGFFTAMLGRQGEFWAKTALDDMTVIETVSTTLVIAGADAAEMWAEDPVNAGVALQAYGAGTFYRRVVDAEVIGDTSYLQLDYDVPAMAFRSASWLFVARFASDDLMIEWVTNTVAQAQVQILSLPYDDPERPLAVDPAYDYFGTTFVPVFGDLLDYSMNGVGPLSGDLLNISELAFQFGGPLDYSVNRSAPKVEEYPQ